MNARLIRLIAFSSLFLVAPFEVNASQVDWLNVSNGAVVISASSQYDAKNNSAIATISGNKRFTWYSKQYNVGPQRIIYELSQEVKLKRFLIDATSEYNRRAPKNGVLSGSTTSSKGPWTKLIDFKMDPKKGRNEFNITGDKPASRWLKLDIKQNWGDQEYIAITELEAYGEPVGKTTYDTDLSGNFNTNYDKMRLSMDGTDVVGCYDWQQGTLSGDTDGRIFRFQWTEVPNRIGSAVMAISADGNRFNGFFFQNRKMQGIWWGTRNKSKKEPRCQLKTNAIATALQQSSRAVLYGIHFDFDSDRLKSSALPTLNQVRDALQANPAWKIEIEGHTDSDGSNAYNLKLSDRRAAAVMKWLSSNGIEASRMTSTGYGESRPVSNNQSSRGRALNRRVEIARK